MWRLERKRAWAGYVTCLTLNGNICTDDSICGESSSIHAVSEEYRRSRTVPVHRLNGSLAVSRHGESYDSTVSQDLTVVRTLVMTASALKNHLNASQSRSAAVVLSAL